MAEEPRRPGATGRTHIILIVHTHWDREWYLPLEVFRQRLVRLVDRLLDILESDPSYRSFHFDGQTIPLLDYEQIRGRSDRLRRMIAAGRIKIGPWFVLPDEFLVGGEAMVRNLEQGFAVCREFGVDPVPVGYLPDMFGHVAQAPQMLRGFGLTTAVVWRGVTPDVFGQTFTWESPDGSAVDAVFLPIGYGYGSNLPNRPDLLFERLENIARQIAGDQPDRIIGLFNGTDHTPPRARTPKNLEAALAGRPGWSWEFGDLAGFVRRVLAAEPPSSRHRGELRSACRTLILPSVASARLYLKKQNFDCETLLGRHAEPLAALALARRGSDYLGFLDYAWRLLLENHPHDSICGCSVDAVHDEMETRFAKVEQVGRRVVSESMAALVPRLSCPGPALAVFNPAGATVGGVVCGEVEGRFRHPLALSLPEGVQEPLQVLETIEPEILLTDQRLPREAGMILLGELVSPELFGLYLQGAKAQVSGGTLDVRLDAGAAPGGTDVAALREMVEKAADDPRVREVRVRVMKLPRLRVAARTPALSGHALTAFPLARRQGRAEDLRIDGSHMRNERLVLQFEPGGTCLVTDNETGLSFRCLRFLDVGDRGDTYNFDPIPDDRPRCEPEKVSLKPLSSGPVAAVMEVRHRFRLPESLNVTRAARSKRTEPLDLVSQVRLFRGSKRIEIHTEFVNPARDHRLQAAVRAPFEAERAMFESAFGLVERPVEDAGLPRDACATDLAATLLGREGTYTTSPHKTLAYISRGDCGVALMNRGLAEAEVRRLDGATRLALTLVRAVGWLSRPDLAMRPGEAGPTLPTPGAQCLRAFAWDYAVEPFSAGEEASLLASAHAFAYPPALSLVHERVSGPDRELWLVRVSNPRVFVCSLRPLAGGTMEVRLVNGSLTEEAAAVEFAPQWQRPQPTDFLGRPVEGRAELKGNRLTVRLRPQEIFTVRAETAAG